MNALPTLKQRLALLSSLAHAGSILSWDRDTQMPPDGALHRALAMGGLSRATHVLSTAPDFAELLAAAEQEAQREAVSAADRRIIELTREGYEREARLPADLIAELREAGVMGKQVWQQARRDNDFARIAPYLERIVRLHRQRAELIGYGDHLYDAVLDQYEPGATTAEIQTLFATLRDGTIPLVRAIADCDPVDDAMLHQPYDEKAQWDLARHVTTLFGFDYEQGRLDPTTHPYCSGIGVGDVRLTSRTDPAFFNSCFFASCHECGHGLYYQGISHAYARTPLWRGASAMVQESQARLWENFVGRSRPFWRFLYPEVQARFAEALGHVPLEQFYRAINRIKPSLIRIESDEVTYNLHIMLRFALELELFEGTLSVSDLPRRWNEGMEEYLGLVPPTDTLGVLQDMHWATGMFGYFPTYTMGNVLAAQLWAATNAEIPALDEEIERGNLELILDWMREKVHRHGRLYEPKQLIERATGGPLRAEPYLAYLQAKVRDLYGVEASA